MEIEKEVFINGLINTFISFGIDQFEKEFKKTNGIFIEFGSGPSSNYKMVYSKIDRTIHVHFKNEKGEDDSLVFLLDDYEIMDQLKKYLK